MTSELSRPVSLTQLVGPSRPAPRQIALRDVAAALRGETPVAPRSAPGRRLGSGRRSVPEPGRPAPAASGRRASGVPEQAPSRRRLRGVPGRRSTPSPGALAALRRPPGWAMAVLWSLALVLGWQAFGTHAQTWVGHNGDHYYYASTALQYAGVDYETSIREATEYFGYPYDPSQLDLGYLNPAVAPLIYPRVVLGILARPAVALVGVGGVWFPGMLCGGIAVLMLMVAAHRRIGRAALVSVPVLVGITGYATEFMFGIYLESPVILAAAAMVVVFPLGTARRGWWYALTAAALVPMMMLSRQVPLLPIAMVFGGWLWAAVGLRRLRNPWWPFLVTVVPVTVMTYWLLNRWAPYDALPYLFAKTGTSTRAELFGALPTMWGQTLDVDWQRLQANDQAMIVVTVIGLVGLLLAIRNPLAGVFLGALGSGIITALLNGQPNDFRYLSPALPGLILLAALAWSAAVHLLWAPIVRWTGLRRRPWAGAALCRTITEPRIDGPEPGPTRAASGTSGASPDPDRPWLPLVRELSRRGPMVWAVASWLVVAGLVHEARVTHPAAPLPAVGGVVVSAADFRVSPTEDRRSWPFSVHSGTLICAGDNYQVWFVTEDGVRYALSGTAMAASWSAPRALDLAPDRIEYGWPRVEPVLNAGMRLCDPDRGFRTARRPAG